MFEVMFVYFGITDISLKHYYTSVTDENLMYKELIIVFVDAEQK